MSCQNGSFSTSCSSAELDFAADGSFDGIVCALVLHPITARRQLLDELHRVLRPGGWLALSTTHPTADWRTFGGSYYSTDWVDPPGHGWRNDDSLSADSLEDTFTELLGAGFLLERVVEPRPGSELLATDPLCTKCRVFWPAEFGVGN